MEFEIVELVGQQLKDALDDVAQLRLQVFAEFPYLYDGTLQSEKEYLEPFAAIDSAVVFACYRDGKLIGAATGSKLSGQFDEFKLPLKSAGFDIDDIYYCSESVLLAPYRGRGVGHVFFDRREEAALRLNCSKSCFLSVIRASDDPRAGDDYRSLEPFWRKRGYQPVDGVTTSFKWRLHGSDHETDNEMQYWMRDL